MNKNQIKRLDYLAKNIDWKNVGLLFLSVRLPQWAKELNLSQKAVESYLIQNIEELRNVQ